MKGEILKADALEKHGHTSSGLRPPSPQSGEGFFPDRSAGSLVAMGVWLAQVGVSPVTAWRWRRKGWLKTVNIEGRVYLTDEARREFNRRAEAGEFAKEHKAPNRSVK